jgi:hypothetical protein
MTRLIRIGILCLLSLVSIRLVAADGVPDGWDMCIALTGSYNVLGYVSDKNPNASVGASSIPEFKITYYPNSRFGVGVAAGYFGFASVASGSVTPTSRTDLNSNNNYAALEFNFRTPIANLNVTNAVLGIGYGNLQSEIGGGQFSQGELLFLGVSTNLLTLIPVGSEKVPVEVQDPAGGADSTP